MARQRDLRNPPHRLPLLTSGAPSQFSAGYRSGLSDAACPRDVYRQWGAVANSPQSEHSERVSGPGHPTVEDAIALAAKAHRGQRYPSPEGEPYVFHPLRLMLRVTDPVEQMASVLHDVIEDTDVSIDDLVEAGYTEDYIDRVARNDVARRVKIADVNENLANNRRLPNSPANTERIGRYTRALERLRSAVPEQRPMSADLGSSPTHILKRQ